MKSFKEFINEEVIDEVSFDVTHKTGGSAKVKAKNEADAIKKARTVLKLGSIALERPQDFKVKEVK